MWLAAAGIGAALALLLIRLWRRSDADHVVREELSRNRQELTAGLRDLRDELGRATKSAGDSAVNSIGALAATQSQQLEAFSQRLVQLTETLQSDSHHLRQEVAENAQRLTANLVEQHRTAAQQQQEQLARVAEQLAGLTAANEQRLTALQGLVDGKLKELRDDNAQQLERMRLTVDEKLHATLEQRLGESFKLVSERLEKVHQGLGEMQALANGVGERCGRVTREADRRIAGAPTTSGVLTTRPSPA